MEPQRLDSEKYLVDQSNDPVLKKLNRKKWTAREIKRVLFRSSLVVVAVIMAWMYFSQDTSGPGYQDSRLLNLGRVIQSMIGELDQPKKIWNSI